MIQLYNSDLPFLVISKCLKQQKLSSIYYLIEVFQQPMRQVLLSSFHRRRKLGSVQNTVACSHHFTSAVINLGLVSVQSLLTMVSCHFIFIYLFYISVLLWSSLENYFVSCIVYHVQINEKGQYSFFNRKILPNTKHLFLVRSQEAFSIKEPNNILGFVDLIIFFATTQLCCWSMNAAMDSIWTNGHDYVPIKFYLYKQIATTSGLQAIVANLCSRLPHEIYF